MSSLFTVDHALTVGGWLFSFGIAFSVAVWNERRKQAGQQQIDAASVTVARLNSADEMRQEIWRELRAEIERLQTSVKDLNSQVAQERRKNRECEERSDRLEARIHELETQAVQREQRIDGLEAQVSAKGNETK